MYTDSENTNPSAGTMRLHCPQCRSTAITPVVETEISGGTSFNHSLSRRNSISSMKFNNIHRNYWMCSNCGHKFRNLQNLEEELAYMEKGVKTMAISAIIFAVVSIFFWAVIGPGIALVGCFLVALLLFGFFYYKHKRDDLQGEWTYLKKHCFN